MSENATNLQRLDLKVLADFAAQAIHFVLLDPTNVVAWADRQIAAGEIPPPWLIDLSLVNPEDPMAVQSALRAVPGEPDPQQSLLLLNALVLRDWRRGRLSIGRVCGIGWQLYRDQYERGDDTNAWGVVVECNGDELDNGFISQAEMRQIIDFELGRFAGYLPRLPSWV